jgi:hypothetical protein
MVIAVMTPLVNVAVALGSSEQPPPVKVTVGVFV